MDTGKRVAYFNNPDHTGPVSFTVSADKSKLIIFTDERQQWSDSGKRRSGVAVWDRATLTRTELNVDYFAAVHPEQIALSADNRYLVIGVTALRIWDLQNLPEKVEDRLPIYRFGGPKSEIWSVRFATPDVIETTSAEGIQDWDLHTGKYIPPA